MQEQTRNLILATVLSIAVIFGYQAIVGKRPANPPPPAPTSPAAPVIAQSPAAQAERSETLAAAPRVPIQTPRLKGSIALAGGRIDDLVLADYYETVAHDKQVTLLSPAGSPAPYYVEQGWQPADGAVPVPTSQTVWSVADNHPLTPESPVTMTWDNGAGLLFERTVSVDQNYLFTVVQKVTNRGTAPVALKPYGSIVRVNPPVKAESGGPAPGVVGVYANGLEEIDYADLGEKGPIQHQTKGGWVGMNDKYWLVTAVPPKDEPVAITLRDAKSGTASRFTVDYAGAPIAVAPGATAESKSLVFAGAKDLNLLDQYADTAGIGKLDRTVNFGWLYFLAKPFFIALDYLARLVGNFGIAILIFNVILKIILFPLQDRSFHQMARMRDLQPKIAALKEKYGEDREKFATAQMELFRREKINPAAGCLPLLVQVPIFFALYRVLITTIEMRQAPFFGWIHDLSAPDPTSLFNLFGLIPWHPPAFLMIGVWPILYGASLFLQQKLTPTPTADPTQAKIMMAMPLVFTLFLAQFPAGLMIYYSWNNLLTIGQMAVIRRRSERRAALAKA